MDPQVAKTLITLLLRQVSEQNTCLDEIKKSAAHADFEQARQIIGTCMGHVYFDALVHLFEQYPSLKPKELE